MSIKLFACGDVVNSTDKQDFLCEKILNTIRSADIALCNFEAPIKTDICTTIPKEGPYVSQSKESVKYIKNAGFNYVSLANNHIYDYGQAALENTIEELKKYSINYIGSGVDFHEAYTTKIIEKNGIKIGLLAACENEFGCLYEEQDRGGSSWIFHPLIEDNIRKLQGKVDAIVLIAHAGVENIDFPIKEWRDRYKRLCDVGVDVIIGHHPHVPQGYEHYNKSVIFYSLGNFYFDTANFRNKADDSYSVLLDFGVDGLKKYDLIYHKKINGQTCKVSALDVSFSIKGLNSLLNSNYSRRNNEISITLFNQYYFSYYETALGVLPKNSNIVYKIKHLIKNNIFRNINKDNRNLMLLHNLRIDTHRFVVQRALSLLSE